MTITSDAVAPLIVVVGATGIQGGSVIRNLNQSPVKYRIRGITRDPNSGKAEDLKRLGVEVVGVNIVPSNEPAVRAAFNNADVVFGMTTISWHNLSADVEEAQGKLIVEAAHAANTKLLVFSGLPNVTEQSGGKYTKVVLFDSKAKVVAYARTLIPTIDVQASGYMSNIINPQMGMRKVGNNQFIWPAPVAEQSIATRAYPSIDTATDYGLFVRHAIESWYEASCVVKQDTFLAFSENCTHEDVKGTLENVLEATVTLLGAPNDPEANRAKLAAMRLPPQAVDAMVDSVGYMAEFGYFFGAEEREEHLRTKTEVERRAGRALRGWKDFIGDHKGRTLEHAAERNPRPVRASRTCAFLAKCKCLFNNIQ
ncbi:NAD(P)-binding protein [Auriculariales sp. MPI-PUGE-AT-0066]|nr:NAD(P)-binding protein [Auriculariales sp. MPI-PUGE-AT-0066]